MRYLTLTLLALAGCSTGGPTAPIVFGEAEAPPYTSRDVAPELNAETHAACDELFARWRVRRVPGGVETVCGARESCLLFDGYLSPVAFLAADLPAAVDLAAREHEAGHALATCACALQPLNARPRYCFRDGRYGYGGEPTPDNRDLHHRAPWWPCVYYGRAHVLAQDQAYCASRAAVASAD